MKQHFLPGINNKSWQYSAIIGVYVFLKVRLVPVPSKFSLRLQSINFISPPMGGLISWQFHERNLPNIRRGILELTRFYDAVSFYNPVCISEILCTSATLSYKSITH